jgi:hypothetical protein
VIKVAQTMVPEKDSPLGVKIFSEAQVKSIVANERQPLAIPMPGTETEGSSGNFIPCQTPNIL